MHRLQLMYKNTFFASILDLPVRESFIDTSFFHISVAICRQQKERTPSLIQSIQNMK